MRQAQLEAMRCRFDAAAPHLEAVLQANPNNCLAWLMLADVHDATGNSLKAVRARYQAITRAQASGRWLDRETTEPALFDTVRRHADTLTRTHREALFGAYQQIRDAHGARSVVRVDHALSVHLGERVDAPLDARQRPKFFYFPGLPAGPYHDPYLHPWAGTLRDAWSDMRNEALALLRDDTHFESFLGLKPGVAAPGYVGGRNPFASWDAYFFFRRGRRFDANHLRCPKTSAALEAVDLCRVGNQAPEVCFSLLRPQTTIERHYGVTNTRLVLHVPLVVPPDCALNVINIGAHAWQPGELMMFDDTYEHEAWNRSDSPRLIVLMDCWNPYLTPPERDAVKLLVEAIDAIEN